jgi:type IV pilus assembly protein PilQ
MRVHNVPWDQALDLILQAKGLGMVQRDGNIIRVAPHRSAQGQERELAIAGSARASSSSPLETRLVPVSYATAAELPRAQELLSPRGTLSVDERTNTIIVRDVTGNLNQIEELVRPRHADAAGAHRGAHRRGDEPLPRDVGIQWGGDGAMSQATGNPTGLAFPRERRHRRRRE